MVWYVIHYKVTFRWHAVAELLFNFFPFYHSSDKGIEILRQWQFLFLNIPQPPIPSNTPGPELHQWRCSWILLAASFKHAMDQGLRVSCRGMPWSVFWGTQAKISHSTRKYLTIRYVTTLNAGSPQSIFEEVLLGSRKRDYIPVVQGKKAFFWEGGSW